MITEIISYEELRKVVVSLFDTGQRLEEAGETFSSRDCGRTYIELCRKLDKFVESLNPGDSIYLRTDRDILEREKKVIEVLTSAFNLLKSANEALEVKEDENFYTKVLFLKQKADQTDRLQHYIGAIEEALEMRSFGDRTNVIDKINKLMKSQKTPKKSAKKKR